MDTVMEVITGRRSIRRYTSEDVPPQVLEDIFAAVRWAPSWANTQCWEIVVVSDQQIKEQLQGVLSPKNPACLAMINAPLVLAVCGKNKVSGFYKGEAVTRHGDWKLYDLGLATQNILLAAASHGLGTVVVGAFDHEKAAGILALPEDVEVVTLVPLGYPDHAPGPPGRKALAEFVHRNQYGSLHE
ncbi:MAG: nitroreductase family protein [Desulfobulbaceae bacterium]|nr:nitroreductase family protein [Desulfobulbaceae bacterium]